MEELVPQPDGCYALCFRNVKNISIEEVQNKFSKFGNVHSIRTSNDATPWIFIRYKEKEEAQSALTGLQSSTDFDIRLAKSNLKKLQEQEGEHRGRSDAHASTSVRENRPAKGNHNRNKPSDKLAMNSEGTSGVGTDKSSPKKSQMFSGRNPRSNDHSYSEGRGGEESHRRNDSPPPRLVKKSPGNHSNGAIPRQKSSGGDGPPKLVKASDYYGREGHGKSNHILASKAAYQEVWENHPLRSEMQIWEMVLTNFLKPPSKKDIYELCAGINLLHVSVAKTYNKELPYCRVLVPTEDDVYNLYELDGRMFNGSEIVVTCLEDLLDSLLDQDDLYLES